MSDNKPTQPISIPHRRPRSVSFSSSSGSDDSNSPPLKTPVTPSPPKVQTAPAVSPSTSPILSYFFASPPRTASGATATTPGALGSFGRSIAKQPSTDVVIEEDEDLHHDADFEPLLVKHARRLSTGWNNAPRIAQTSSATDPQSERGAGLLRRLSLGSALRPQPQNGNSAINAPPPTPATTAPSAPSRAKTPPSTSGSVPVIRKTRRSATISESRPRRAPSPMGERILKGHFDGFN